MEDSRKSRLMISNMVLENFKSYAGAQKIGPFHKSFSSIVGPNGSGKSNVIDALLFVFGKRAKQLRLNKVSELIHKSANFPHLEYARVSIEFQLIYDDEDHADAFEVVPSSEFTVTRFAYTNNESKYFVNDTKSTYTQVGQLLRGYGIDLDNNRFLILQGEVEQIAMMKPKAATQHEDGLLEYLEDIIGSNKYIEKINEVSVQLDGLNEVRLEKVNRLRISEKDRDRLSDARAEAEDLLDKERDIRRNKNQLYQILLYDTSANIEEISDTRAVGVAELESKREFLREEDRRLKQMEQENKHITKEYDRLDKELNESKANLAAFDRRDVKLKEDLKHAASQLKKFESASAKDAKKETDCTSEAEQLKKQIIKSSQTLASTEERRVEEEAALDKIMSGLQESTAELRGSLETANERLIGAERVVAHIQTQKEKAATELELLLERYDTVVRTKSGLEQKLVGYERDVHAQEESSSSAREVVDETMRRKKSLIKQLEALTQEEESLQLALRAAVMHVEELKSSSGACAKNSVANAIMKASKKGGALHGCGIRGRLGDLGTITPELDVAVSSACSMLDFIVVDTAAGAEKAIEFLRHSKQGRGNFIALDQIHRAAEGMNRPVQVPTGAKRLFDLINATEEAFRPAFYLALKDTLVTQDLNAATAIAYDGNKVRWRVVTLDGKLIELSGAMTGGGDAPKAGGMLLSSGKHSSRSTDEITPEAIAAAESESKAIQDRLSKCRAAKSDSEREFDSVEKSLKTMLETLDKATASIPRLQQHVKDTKAKMASLELECQLTAAEQKKKRDLETDMLAIDKSMQEASPDLNNFRAAVQSLQEQIFNVGGPRLKRAQLKLDETVAKIDLLSSEIARNEVEVNTAEKNASKAHDSKIEIEKEIATVSKKQKDLLAEVAEMEDDAFKVIQAVQETEALLAAQETAKNAIESQYSKIKAGLSEARKREVELESTLQESLKSVEDNQRKAISIRKDLTTLRGVHEEELREYSTMTQAYLPKKVFVEGAVDETAMEVDAEIPVVADREASLAEFTNEEIKDMINNFTSKQEDFCIRDFLKGNINALELTRDKMKDSVNMAAIKEYMRKDADCRARMDELEGATNDRNTCRRAYEDLRHQRLEEFMAGFGVISLRLKEMYQMITLGGDAELELVDTLDPFSEGVVFSVRPPKKSWKNISNLSGGEKTLSSLALVFALHHYKPTPLYVMDEIDAALDFKNVSIVANYIKERTKNAQFVIISLRNNMFELADRLVGIYKTHDATKSVTIDPKVFAKTTPTAQPTPLMETTNLRL